MQNWSGSLLYENDSLIDTFGKRMIKTAFPCLHVQGSVWADTIIDLCLSFDAYSAIVMIIPVFSKAKTCAYQHARPQSASLLFAINSISRLA